MKGFGTPDSSRATRTICEEPPHDAIRPDPLRRFSSIAYGTNVSVMGKCVRFETNHGELCEYVRRLLSCYPPAQSQQPQFQWKVIVDPADRQVESSLTRFAFSEAGFRYASFGQRNFIAVDLASRKSVAYIANDVARDQRGMLIRFLDTLFYMTAASLGFVSLFANCVEFDGYGILLMGPPGSGKTTASYLATKVGMSLHADEGVLLELVDGALAGWGGFWPLIFRQETLRFLPELRDMAEPFVYGEFSFCHVAKHCLSAHEARPVTPKYCIFLRRQASESVQISHLSPDDLRERLRHSLLFEEDHQFRLQTSEVLAKLSALEGYEISYGSDPAAVVPTIR